MLALAGFVLGCGAGLKNTLVIYVLGSTIACACLWRSWQRLPTAGFCWLLGLGVGVGSTSGYWALQLWRQFASPVFPFYNAIFESPYFEARNFADVRFLPRTVPQAMFYPFYFTIGNLTTTEIPFQDLRLAALYAACLLALGRTFLRAIDRSRARDARECVGAALGERSVGKWLLVFCVSSYLIWQITFSVYRYVAPLEQLVPIAIVIVLNIVLVSERRLVLTVLFLFMILSITVRAPQWGRLKWSDSFFGVAVPKIADPDRSLVVITSNYPLAYVIPAFPEEVRFVRIQSDFFDPRKDDRMAREIRDVLARHEGPFYLLTAHHALHDAPPLLARYGLVRDGLCLPVRSRLPDGIELCPLRRAA